MFDRLGKENRFLGAGGKASCQLLKSKSSKLKVVLTHSQAVWLASKLERFSDDFFNESEDSKKAKAILSKLQS
jgi:hypothetical protein